MLGTLSSKQKADCKTYITPLVQAYNCTRHDSTGFSPHYLMFGWHPRIPVDVYLGPFQRDDQASDHKTYAARLRERLEYAYRSAAAEASRQSTKSEAAYNQRVRDSKLKVGDTVLVWNVGLQGKHKLADRWDSNPLLFWRCPTQIFQCTRSDVGIRSVLYDVCTETCCSLSTVFLWKLQEKSARTPPRSCRGKQPTQSSGSELESSESDVPRYVIPQRRISRQNASPTQTHSPPVSPPVLTPSSHHQSHPLQNNHPAPHTHPEQRVYQTADTSPPRPARPVRIRRSPDRYGEWVTPIFLSVEDSSEVFV